MYEIKPLEWKERGELTAQPYPWEANTEFCVYYIIQNFNGAFEYGNTLRGKHGHAPTVEIAKAAAEKHWQERVKECLVEKVSLEERLKQAHVNYLLCHEHLIDEPFMVCGQKTYTRRDLATEIENETDFGIETLRMSVRLALDLLARGREKPIPVETTT